MKHVMKSGKLRSVGTLAGMLCLTGLLSGCSTTPGEGGAVPRDAGNARCSLRAVVNVRQGTAIRSDADLVDVGRRLGVHLDVLQSMGRSSKMVMIRENGPQARCEESVALLRNDLRIESVQQY